MIFFVREFLKLKKSAKKIKETTPLSFETSLKQLGLMDVGSKFILKKF